MAVLSVSDGELRRLEVVRDVDRGGLPVGAAAQLLGRSERQVWRLLRAFRRDGAAGLISKKRGRPSNRKTAASVRVAALWIVRRNYADFGPTLAAEKLASEHGLAFSSETLRKWMIADGLWLDRKQRQRRVHQPRPRRECVGELVQVDGSEHWWFEDRGPQCTLLVSVDDATSRLMHLQFVESESTPVQARGRLFAYFHAARAYLEAWGKPVAFYSDKHGVFRVNHPGALGGDGMTQFGRALHALNIDIICANSCGTSGGGTYIVGSRLVSGPMMFVGGRLITLGTYGGLATGAAAAVRVQLEAAQIRSEALSCTPREQRPPDWVQALFTGLQITSGFWGM
jgi:transposase